MVTLFFKKPPELHNQHLICIFYFPFHVELPRFFELSMSSCAGWRSLCVSCWKLLKARVNLFLCPCLFACGHDWYVYTVCFLCVWLAWNVCCDTDKWRCSLSNGSPGCLCSLLCSIIYLWWERWRAASVCHKTIHLQGEPSQSPSCNFHSLSHFLKVWLFTAIQNFTTPSNFHIWMVL